MVNHIIYYAFSFFKLIIMILPEKLRIALFKGLGSFLYRLNMKHRRIIMANLTHAFGDSLSTEEKEAATKRCYQNFLVYISDFIYVSNRPKSFLQEHVTIENPEILDNALANGESVVLVSAHYGAWELILQTVGGFKAPISTIGEALMNSPRLNDVLVAYRERNNVQMFKKEGALVGVVKAMKKGRILAYLVDQHYGRGVKVAFFGKPVKHIQSASQISRKYDALLLPVFCTTDDYRHYTIRFQEPFKCDVTDDEEADILRCTQRQSDIIEAAVRERPADYFWFHKKFKFSAPELYKKP